MYSAFDRSVSWPVHTHLDPAKVDTVVMRAFQRSPNFILDGLTAAGNTKPVIIVMAYGYASAPVSLIQI